MILVIFFLIVLLVCVVLALFRKPAEEVAEEKRLRESLLDETIYLPETGTTLTLEEAEKGHFIAHDNKVRLKTESELAQHYSWEEGQVEKIRNHAIEAGYTSPTDEAEDTLLEAIGNCGFTRRYSDIQLSYTFQVNASAFILLLRVAYRLSNEKHQSESTEWHIAAAAHRGSMHAGPYASELQQQAIEKELGALGADYTAETSGEYLVMKLYRHATLSDAQQIIGILKKVTTGTQ